MQTHVGEAFVEWISCSAHFTVNPLSLAEGWCHAVVALEWCRHQSWAEYQALTIPILASTESDSSPQLVGSAPPSAVKVALGEEAGGGWAARVPSTRPCGRPPKSQPVIGGRGNSLPSSLERGGVDSDGYSAVRH